MLQPEDTQPTRSLAALQRSSAAEASAQAPRHPGRSLVLGLASLFAAYLLAPLRTTVLLLGTDDAPARGPIGRTDRIVLVPVVPLRPYVSPLSIPRDLWTPISDVGPQRVNTAHFFAETARRRTGGPAAAEAVAVNFQVPVAHFAVAEMQGLAEGIDKLGSLVVELAEPGGGLAASSHRFTGSQALAFVRDRSTDDDFERMKRRQLALGALLSGLTNPATWNHIPGSAWALRESLETNLPARGWPRLAFAP